MPIKVDILTEHNLFMMKAVGLVDYNIMFDFQSSIKDVQGYKPTLNTLFDFSMVDNNLLSPESLIKFSATTPFEPGCQRAYVVHDEMAAILATIFGTTTSNNSDNFFVTFKIEDACEWLDIAYSEITQSDVYAVDK